MKKFLGFLFVIILITGCIDDVLNPDIEVVRHNPLGFYIIDEVRAVTIDSTVVVAKNSQDCHITEFFWEFYDHEDNLIYAAEEPFPIDVAVHGIVNPEEVDTTYIFGITVQTDTLSNYLFQNDLWSAKIKYYFVAEADHFAGRMDTEDFYIGVYRVKVTWLTNLTAVPDSIPRDSISASKITVTAQDFAGNPLVGATLGFSTTLGNLSAMYGITGSDGQTSVYLFSDVGTTPANAWVTVDHTYASFPLQILVKFYIPEDTTKFYIPREKRKP